MARQRRPRRKAPERPSRRARRPVRRSGQRRTGRAPCIFCSIVRGEAPAAIVGENPGAVAFLTLGPLRPGHTLVVPRAHAETLAYVRPKDWQDVARLALRVSRLHQRRLGSRGANLFLASGAAGEQSVGHLHLHVVPRSTGDALDLNGWWQSKVHPASREELGTIASRLRSSSR